MEIELNKASDQIQNGDKVTIQYLNFALQSLEKKIDIMAETIQKILKEVAYSDEEDDEDYEDDGDMEEEVIKKKPKVEMHTHEYPNNHLYSSFKLPRQSTRPNNFSK